MIAVRLAEDAEPTVVASPDYLARHGPPPQLPGDLQGHNCARLRLASGAMHRWSFKKRGNSLEYRITA